MQKLVTYFKKAGSENTTQFLDIVKKAIADFNYKHIVVASTTGSTGLLFAETLKGDNINLVVVTHSHGFKEPNTSEFPDAVKEKIIASGAKVYTGTMITHRIHVSV